MLEWPRMLRRVLVHRPATKLEAELRRVSTKEQLRDWLEAFGTTFPGWRGIDRFTMTREPVMFDPRSREDTPPRPTGGYHLLLVLKPLPKRAHDAFLTALLALGFAQSSTDRNLSSKTMMYLRLLDMDFPAFHTYALLIGGD